MLFKLGRGDVINGCLDCLRGEFIVGGYRSALFNSIEVLMRRGLTMIRSADPVSVDRFIDLVIDFGEPILLISNDN